MPHKPPPQPFRASIGAADWPAITESLRKFWPQIFAATRADLAHFARHAARSDRLRIYLEVGGGMIYFGLSPPSPDDEYWEVASLQIRQAEEEYFALPDSEISERDFEQAHEELMRRLKSALKASCTPELSPLPITVLEYSDLETEKSLSEA